MIETKPFEKADAILHELFKSRDISEFDPSLPAYEYKTDGFVIWVYGAFAERFSIKCHYAVKTKDGELEEKTATLSSYEEAFTAGRALIKSFGSNLTKTVATNTTSTAKH